jgi:transketolase
MRNAFLRGLTRAALTDPRIVLITGDLGFSVLDDFAARLPRQFINAGVAEQNMTAIATGLALEGHTVFTYSIGNFPTLRCLEQLRNDAFYHDANVKVVSVGGGFSYGQLGMSHHATEDLSILRALPNVTICAPATAYETEILLDALIALPGPAYLRLERSAPDFKDQAPPPCELGRARVFRDGNACTLIGCGGVVSEVVRAADLLARRGIDCRVLSLHTLKPLDVAAIVAAARETGALCTVEENVLQGGLGGAVAEACLDAGCAPRRFLRIGLPDRYTTIVGDQDYLRAHHGLDRDSIANAVVRLLS